MDEKYIKKIKDITKYYHKYENILELVLYNYENLDFYIRIDHDKKRNKYYVHFANLNDYQDKFDKNILSSSYIIDEVVKSIYNALNELNKKEYINIDDTFFDYVYFHAYYNNNEYHYEYNKYTPKEIIKLNNIIRIIFLCLPHRLLYLCNELLAIETNTTNNYEYYKFFKFNLKKDNIDDLFNVDSIDEGNSYINNHQIRFLEYINPLKTYYGVLEDNMHHLQIITIYYDDKKKIMRFSCSNNEHMHCKHEYAILKSIKNKKKIPFYKVRYVYKDESLLNKLTSFNNILLSIGCDDKNMDIITYEGNLLKMPLKDKNGNLNFEIIEDDKDNTLYKKINNI